MMTRDAQAALRRIIENYSSVTRFCIICNYISRFVDRVLDGGGRSMGVLILSFENVGMYTEGALIFH